MSDPGTTSSEAFVDLHSHSTASDGAASPRVMVETAHAAGLAAVALTDHDTLGGVDEALAVGAELGIRVIPGAELSTTDGQREWHLLALHVHDRAGLDAQLAPYREARIDRASRIVEKLEGVGAPIAYTDVLAEAAGGAVGRPHIARVLIAAGHVLDFREAFDRYLGYGRPAFVEKELIPIADAITMVHRCGGITVLAHPGPEGRAERVATLAAAGLDGLEIRHPGHAPEVESRLTKLAAQHGLVRSGGSDWHGASDGTRVLNGMRVPHAWLVEQDERVARVRATA